MGARLEMIPNATPTTEFIALENIPQDVKDDVQAILRNTVTNDCRTRVSFETEDEGKVWFRQAASYCHHESLKIRRSPTRDLPPTKYDVRVHRQVAGEAPPQRRKPKAK